MSSVEEYNCVFCQETFGNKEDLQTHFRKHGDPNYNQNHNKNRLQSDATSSKNDQGEVGCDVCSEVFPTISKAITHKHKVHPDYDTKYFCPWCGKLFTLKHLYSKHLQATHENEVRTENRTLHCDCCDVDFYCQAALISHNKFFHRQDDLPMVGQSKKLKLYDKVVVQIYYCSFCGEEYENKINLHKHIQDDHGDENQSPDDILRCPLCDAIFFHLDAYEVHLTFHSVEDVYTEKNELFSDVTDFSLESILPICEKVESYDPKYVGESEINAMGIEKFLELAMDSEATEAPKNKKHKKHKKSKKEAITLDEFLNMNKDVFGEDLDVQGVEEVPTQVISKQLKVRKPQNSTKAKLNPELEKLKKQGIVIKKKPTSNTISPLTNKTIKISPEALKSIRPGVKLKTQNDSMSKLVKQNELNVGRKPSQDKTITSKENEEKLKNAPNQQIDEKIMTETITSNNTPDSNHTENQLNSLNENLSTAKAIPDNVVNNQSLSNETAHCNINDEQANIDDKSVIVDSEQGAQQTSNINKGNKISTIESFKKEQLQPEVIENGNKQHSNEMNYKQLIDNNSNKDTKESEKLHVNSSLSALKHLSHLLTIKPVNSPKSSPDLKNIDAESAQPDSYLENHDNDANKIALNTKQPTLKVHHENNQKVANTIKNLGRNITIKTVGQPLKDTNTTSTLNDDCDENKCNEKDNAIPDKGTPTKTQNSTRIDYDKLEPKESGKILKNSEQPNDIPKCNKVMKEEHKEGDIPNFDEDSTSQTNKDILKRLSHITAKPVKNTCNQLIPFNKTPQLQNKTKITTQINEDNIEVFNIDDSDSDETHNAQNIPDGQVKPTLLKNLNKNVTMKPPQKQQTINKSFTKTITKSQTLHNVSQSYHSEESFNKTEYRQAQATKSISTKTVAQTAANEKSLALKNVLKNLGKNITVKSRTSSPSNSIKSQDNDSQDSYNEVKGDESDKHSEPGNVKITELNDEINEDEIKDSCSEQNAIVESPNCSENSDDESHHEDINEGDDIESQIMVNKVKKPITDNQTQKSVSSQNMKNVSVKSTNDSLADPVEESTNAIVPFIPKALGSQISVKPLKQRSDVQNESVKNVRQINASTSNQMTMNQRISNQTNTVNKAVTVKTFQTETETVIEEITTTVTKTIKTVKQETRNTASSSSVVTVPQKVKGIRPNQSMKNYQGTQVRHMPPTGLRIKNPMQVNPGVCAPVRATNQVPLGPVRPSTQMVVARPKGNVARLSTPRMPKNNPGINNTGKPIRISPNAVVSSSSKRVNTDEASGPFSCFKKPKESLIPVSDISFSGVGQDTIQFTSSQINKSNVVSTVKTIKGNSVVSQMKAEMSTSSQHLSKLSNMSGLKVAKSNVVKQSVVQEKSEFTAPKRTLDAIEKLQKSGLLVKKPRIEVNEESDHSEHEEENPTYESGDDSDE